VGAARAGAVLREPDERTRHRAGLALGAAVAAGLAAGAALTTPFTAAADTVTAIGLGLVAVEVALRWRPAVAGPSIAADAGCRRWPWLALVLVVVTWELVCFFLGPRVDHPTISSLYDSATQWRAVKGAFFFAWLVLGSALVRA
jgi:hypothetical protein